MKAAVEYVPTVYRDLSFMHYHIYHFTPTSTGSTPNEPVCFRSCQCLSVEPSAQQHERGCPSFFTVLRCYVKSFVVGKTQMRRKKKRASFGCEACRQAGETTHAVWSLPSRGEGAEEPHPWSTEPESAFLRNLGALLSQRYESEPPSC